MRLVLTRHGETVENINGVLQGHTPGKLSEKGVEQAKKLALRLKDEKFDAVYSSDLGRAADTTKEIVKFHHGIDVYYVEDLREGSLGSFTGRPRSEIDWDNRPADIETKESMQKRVKELLDKVYEKYPEGNVLFVGHNGINQALITVILDKSPDQIRKFEDQLNKKHKIELLNCVEHLE